MNNILQNCHCCRRIKIGKRSTPHKHVLRCRMGLILVQEILSLEADNQRTTWMWICLFLWKILCQSFSHLSSVQLFATLWTIAHQASLSITNFWSLLKHMSINSVMPSNRLVLCHPLLPLSSIFPSMREISLKYSLERLMLKLKLQYFGHLMQKTDSLEKILWGCIVFIEDPWF